MDLQFIVLQNVIDTTKLLYEILRPKPFNLKWTKIVEEQFISNLNNIDLKSISDKIVSFKQKS